jgi:hypothetical protein
MAVAIVGARWMKTAVEVALETERAEQLLAAVVPEELRGRAHQEAAFLQRNAEVFYGKGRVHPAYGARRLYEEVAAGHWPPEDDHRG